MFKKKKKKKTLNMEEKQLKKKLHNYLHKYLTNGPKVEEILHMAYNLTKKP